VNTAQAGAWFESAEKSARVAATATSTWPPASAALGRAPESGVTAVPLDGSHAFLHNRSLYSISVNTVAWATGLPPELIVSVA
jgi:hypothetical protein